MRGPVRARHVTVPRIEEDALPHMSSGRTRQRLRAAALALLTVLGSASVVGVRSATACDVCSIYIGTTKQEQARGPFIAIAQQFTSFTTLQLDGEQIPNFDDEKIDSSITQFVLGYTVNPRLHFQFNVPLISRHFRRATLTGTETDDETGIGDVSLAGRYSLVQRVVPRSIINLDLMLGVKFPTGNTDRLGEESVEVEGEEADEGTTALRFDRHPGPKDLPRHDGPGGTISGVHGHDLTLGTGSFDAFVGASSFTTYRRAFFSGAIQYMVRTEGDFDYTFANDLQWEGGPGAYLLLNHNYTLALQAWFLGESKGKDTQAGVRLDDTAITALYLGPRLTFSYSTRSHADIGVAFPLIQNTTELQLVPDYRLRAAWVWHF
jgi:hypothetical protein